MTRKNKKYQLLISTLLLCFLQMAGIDVYAQAPVTPVQKDTTITHREPPKARARRHRDPMQEQDSLRKDSIVLPPKHLQSIDSLSAAKIQVADSLDAANKKELKKMYKDYSQAYLDIMDSNPNTKSYEDLLPPNSSYNEEQLKSTLKRRKDMFRRYRDLSIFAFIGVYLISIIDAYVDAELSNFDITPDLSMKVEPAVIDNNNQFRSNSLKSKSVGLQCVLRF